MPGMTFGQMRQQADEQGFSPHPVGTYNFKVDKADVVQGKMSKQIRLRLVNTDGPYAGKSVLNRLAPVKNDGDPNGMFFQQMGALGFGNQSPVWAQLESLEVDQGIEWLAPQLVDRMVTCDIVHEEYGGEMRDNVKRMKPFSGMMAGPGAVPGVPPAGAPPVGAPPAPTPFATPTPGVVSPPAPAPAPQVPVPAPTPQPMPVTTPQMPQPQPAQMAPQTINSGVTVTQADAPPPAPPVPPQVPPHLTGVPTPPPPLTDTPDPF